MLEAEIVQTKLKARDEVDAQLRTLAEKERTFAEQLSQLQQTANEAHAAQIEATQLQLNTFAQQHAQREQALQLAIKEKESELSQAQYELLEQQRVLEAEIAQTKLQARDEVDTQLRILAEKERTFAEQLSQLQQAVSQEQSAIKDKYTRAIFDLNNKLVKIQSAFTWRLTAPLRSISALFGAKSDFSPIDSGETLSVLPSNDAQKTNINPETITLNDSMPTSINNGKQEMPTENLTIKTITAASTLDELLSYDNDAFITCAYLTLLGRTPDIQGFLYYMGRLKKTGSKLAVIYQIGLSQEAKNLNCNISGLQAALKRQKLRQTPIFGILLSAFNRNPINKPILNIDKASAISTQDNYRLAETNKTDNNYISDYDKQINNLFKSFDAAKYLELHPDVAAARINPYEHFMTSGWCEGRALATESGFLGNTASEISQNNPEKTLYFSQQNSIQSTASVDNKNKLSNIANYLMQPADDALQGDGYTFTQLMDYIWTSRLDLHNVFKIDTSDGRLEFCKWFLLSASQEYGLTPNVYPKNLLDKLALLGGDLSVKAKFMLDSQTNITPKNDNAKNAQPDTAGANLIGYAFGEFGMGEHVRMVAKSLNTTDFPFCIIDQDVGLHGSGDASASHWVKEKPQYDINIFHVNADVFPPLYFKFGESFFDDRYNIGYWAWELSECPPEFDLALNMVDEVWSISEFVTESFKTRSPVPVVTMPLAVTVPELDPTRYTKSYYGLQKDKFTFYFTFDAASYLDRKNPIAVVRAFKLAFPKNNKKVHLLLKTMNIEVAGPLWATLLAEIGKDPRITIMSKRLTRDEVLGLNLACDAFVSLHRSEGFGRCVAEAMAYGKPVIVTNYSGTRDFAMEGTACVVDYQLIPVPEATYPYGNNQVWAEPDVKHAANLMRKLVNDKSFNVEISIAGQKYILDNFNEVVIGEKYADRLSVIENRKNQKISQNKLENLKNSSSQNSTVIFTIVSKNYLAYARTLLKSVAKVHPEFKLCLCLVDKVDGYFEIENEPFSVVLAEDLNIPNFTDMSIRYDIMELNTAVKPFMFRWLFDNVNIDNVIYLDPDIRVYSRLDQLLYEFSLGASVILTPHISEPLEDGKLPNDHSMLQAGVFNLGFIAAKRCDEAIKFIDWWARKLTTQAVSDLTNNLFTDQKWCDLAPCLLTNLKVLQHPGFNVAYWNLAHRNIEETPEYGWHSNSYPLAFFHFSGINAKHRELVSKHQNRFSWNNINKDCQKLFSTYMDELVENGWDITSQWPYAYSSLPNKFPLTTVVRLLYRSVHLTPFNLINIDIEKYLIEICNQTNSDYSQDGTRITQLMALIYRLRPDLQHVFNLQSTEGRNRFVEWYRSAGSTEYNLPKSIII